MLKNTEIQPFLDSLNLDNEFKHKLFELLLDLYKYKCSNIIYLKLSNFQILKVEEYMKIVNKIEEWFKDLPCENNKNCFLHTLFDSNTNINRSLKNRTLYVIMKAMEKNGYTCNVIDEKTVEYAETFKFTLME